MMNSLIDPTFYHQKYLRVVKMEVILLQSEKTNTSDTSL